MPMGFKNVFWSWRLSKKFKIVTMLYYSTINPSKTTFMIANMNPRDKQLLPVYLWLRYVIPLHSQTKTNKQKYRYGMYDLVPVHIKVTTNTKLNEMNTIHCFQLLS